MEELIPSQYMQTQQPIRRKSQKPQLKTRRSNSANQVSDIRHIEIKCPTLLQLPAGMTKHHSDKIEDSNTLQVYSAKRSTQYQLDSPNLSHSTRASSAQRSSSASSSRQNTTSVSFSTPCLLLREIDSLNPRSIQSARKFVDTNQVMEARWMQILEETLPEVDLADVRTALSENSAQKNRQAEPEYAQLCYEEMLAVEE